MFKIYFSQELEKFDLKINKIRFYLSEKLIHLLQGILQSVKTKLFHFEKSNVISSTKILRIYFPKEVDQKKQKEHCCL